GMKMVVVDPRLSKTAEKAHQWVPVKPGQDLALMFGMMRWIIENQRYDARYLANPNKAAATKDGEPTWSDATFLINLSDPARPRLRAKDVGLGDETQFVVMEGGKPALADKAAEGQLEVDTEISGMKVKSTFTLLKERVYEHTLAEYADMCGVSEKTIVEMADEFTAHGKRAAAIGYRGISQHTNGFYTVYAVNMLNFLIGNEGWKGGENSFANRFIEVTGRYDLDMIPGGYEAWGISLVRESSTYEQTTLFERDGYPAKRRWNWLGGSRAHEMIPSGAEGYPYPLKVLFLNRISPLESMPGGIFQVEMLKDETKIPTVVAIDVTVGGTSQYADYILPEPTYLERFNLEQRPNQHPKESHIAQPAIWVMDGPRSAEDIWIDIGKRLGFPGVGDRAFPDGSGLHWAGDYYLKMIANIATDTTSVPDASDEEECIFLEARRAALGSQFDERQWRGAVKPEDWRKVIFVLNRGGRFAKANQVFEGQWFKMRYGRLCNFYDEGVAASKNSFSGEYNDGLPRLEPVQFYNGKPVEDNLPLKMISWKSNFLGTHRTVSNPWLREIRDNNPLWIHPSDAAARGIKTGDRIRIRSASGTVEAEAYVTEAIRPGVVGADFSGGHEVYGHPVEIDGVKIPVTPGYDYLPFDFRKEGNEPTGYAPDRLTGFRVNDLMRQDDYLGKGNPLVDSIGGSVSQLDTVVEIEKV
ncbi:MAG TPA: molybdopterin dinucleotide binding domain-containing protein, partial [Symbiobacteriaceae bacterium]|nr:molybdopterin dinucleotide binding domain-containing protein [Symbiobacteriaceae bacterium]